jgi:hypothetical protein
VASYESGVNAVVKYNFCCRSRTLSVHSDRPPSGPFWVGQIILRFDDNEAGLWHTEADEIGIILVGPFTRLGGRDNVY